MTTALNSGFVVLVCIIMISALTFRNYVQGSSSSVANNTIFLNSSDRLHCKNWCNSSHERYSGWKFASRID
jgi:hypothetical protein